jgi:predicted Zn finger-like uncharacterized protein
VKISCPTCAAKYSVADEKIQSRLAKIRCRKCSSTIVIDGMSTPASVYIGDASSPMASGAPQDLGGAAEPAPASGRAGGFGFSDPAPMTSEPVGPAADEYAVDIADNDQRNMTIHQIVGAYNEGIITADTYIWKEGMADWQTLAEVRAVANALHAAARPAVAAMPAAVRRAEQGASADLFGSIETAGGEDDITTSAPEQSMSAGTGTGARNESSVLFSLSALTGTPDASNTSGGAKRGRGTSDDSGLIDLQALTAQEAAGGGGFGSSGGAFGASPLISAPLGGVSGPVLGSSLTQGYGGRRSGSRNLILAATALAIAIIGGAVFVVTNRGASDEEATSSLDKTTAAAASDKVAAEPAEPEERGEPAQKREPAAEAAAAENSVAADELPTAAPERAATRTPALKAPPAVQRAPRPPARAKPQAAAPVSAPEPVAAPAPASSESASKTEEAKKAKKKPAGPRCDCKPADLMCAMRCSAKK